MQRTCFHRWKLLNNSKRMKQFHKSHFAFEIICHLKNPQDSNQQCDVAHFPLNCTFRISITRIWIFHYYFEAKCDHTSKNMKLSFTIGMNFPAIYFSPSEQCIVAGTTFSSYCLICFVARAAKNARTLLGSVF